MNNALLSNFKNAMKNDVNIRLQSAKEFAVKIGYESPDGKQLVNYHMDEGYGLYQLRKQSLLRAKMKIDDINDLYEASKLVVESGLFRKNKKS